jgi:hypothetical protein
MQFLIRHDQSVGQFRIDIVMALTLGNKFTPTRDGDTITLSPC